jgi:high-affinity iron transporter
MGALQAALVTFREGIEAFVVVGVIIAYLRGTRRVGLVRGVRIGLGVSVATCLVGAWLWLQVPNQPLYEGVAALTAALFVGMLLWHTTRSGSRLKQQIEARVGRAAGLDGAEPSTRALAAVAVVTALLVTREGLEAVFFLGVQMMAMRTASDRAGGLSIVAGAVLGIVLAAGFAWSWTRVARRLRLAVVLRVTSVFLAVFLLQLVVYGVHELAESGVIRGSQAFHDATEAFGPDGRIGHAISYSLLGAPLLYLFWARRGKTTASASAAPGVVSSEGHS